MKPRKRAAAEAASAPDSESLEVVPESLPEVANALQLFKKDAEQRLGNLESHVETLSQRVDEVEEGQALPHIADGRQTPDDSQMSALRRDSEKKVSLGSEDSEVSSEIHEAPLGKQKRTVGFAPPSAEFNNAGKRNYSRGSVESKGSHRSSTESSIFDPWEGTDHGTFYNANTIAAIASSPRTKRQTIFRQVKIAAQIPLPYRILGVCLAFVTVIFLWETNDLCALLLFPKLEVRLIAYLALFLAAIVALTFSHGWIQRAESSLIPSFAYSLSTLYMAMAGWGAVRTVIDILVQKAWDQLFVYATGGFITLIATVMYSLQTRHNVLLDIASCATTLGLHDKDEEDSASDCDA